MKYSKQRELIINALREHPTHPTADEIYYIVRQQEPKISLGTVYRNLNQLADNGIIIKIAVQSGSDRFDARLEPHIHVVCKECGAVEDVDEDLTKSLCKDIEEKTGFTIKNEKIVLEGLCKNCMEKQNKSDIA